MFEAQVKELELRSFGLPWPHQHRGNGGLLDRAKKVFPHLTIR